MGKGLPPKPSSAETASWWQLCPVTPWRVATAGANFFCATTHVLQHDTPDNGASTEDEGERADEDDNDVKEQPEGVVTCKMHSGSS